MILTFFVLLLIFGYEMNAVLASKLKKHYQTQLQFTFKKINVLCVLALMGQH